MIPSLSANRLPAVRFAFCLLVLWAVYGLKAYYSQADSESLAWILGPTAAAAQMLSGISFEREVGAGWVNLDYRIVIAPACAGINFLIVSFCMSAFQGIFRLKTVTGMFVWVGLAGVTAYGLTIIVNAVRIWLSVVLYQSDIYTAVVTPEAIHRIAGVCVYYLFLCFYYPAVSFMLSKMMPRLQSGSNSGKTNRPWLIFIPLVWYLLFSLVVPLINNAYGLQPEQFVEHVLVVGATSLALTLMLLVLSLSYRHVFGRVSIRYK